MMQAEQPEGLRLAELLEKTAITFGESKRGSKALAAAELRRLHTEVEQLRAQLAAQAQQRKRLTDEQLADALRAGGVDTQYHTDFLGRERWTTCGSMDPRKIARAIERAHGITAGGANG